MEFGFTEAQEKFRQELRDFCATTPKGEIAPASDTTINYSPTFYRKTAERGWIGLGFPKEYGGLGLDSIYQTIFFEEMSALGAPLGIDALGTSITVCGSIILKGGTEQQKKEYLSRLARGEINWIGQGITEPNAGSDLVSVQTRAVREGDDYIINGQKLYISCGHRKGSYLLLMARTDRDAPLEKGISFFILPTQSPGITVRPLWTMGAMRTNEVFFDDVRVPKQWLLGEERGLNRGWEYFRECQYCDWERSPGAYVGMLGAAFKALVRYVKETKRDGQPLSKNPCIRQKLAELATELEILRLLLYKKAWVQNKGLDVLQATAIQAVFSDELMVKFAHIAMQVLGLYGQLGAGSKHAVLGGAIESLYRITSLYLFINTGELTRKNFIATHVLDLPESHGY